jgi:hypothetical protein
MFNSCLYEQAVCNISKFLIWYFRENAKIKSHANGLLFAETKQKTKSYTRIFLYFETFSESIQIHVNLLLYNMYFQTTMTTVSSCYLIKETTLPN